MFLKIASHNENSHWLITTHVLYLFEHLFLTDPPAVEPAFLEIRQGQERSVTMSCRVLRAYPIRVLTYEWRLGNKLLRTGQFDSQEYTEYPVKSLSNDNYGVYNCSIINEAGAGRCSFLVTGKISNILHIYMQTFCKFMEHIMSNSTVLIRALFICFEGKSILGVKIVYVSIKLEVYRIRVKLVMRLVILNVSVIE